MPLALLGLFGCKEPIPTEPSGLCPETDDPMIEVAQRSAEAGAEWGMVDGDPVKFGIPPQGGAPYAPFDLRLIGMPSSNDGYAVVTDAIRTSDGERVGEGRYVQRFICANVGANEGTRFAAEFHMRFFGFEPPELADEEVEIYISVTPDGGETVETTFTSPLDWVLGPMPE
jgi:hypothetical protein